VAVVAAGCQYRPDLLFEKVGLNRRFGSRQKSGEGEPKYGCRTQNQRIMAIFDVPILS